MCAAASSAARSPSTPRSATPSRRSSATTARRPNCLIADGCHLFGKAENSVIFREVDIEEGAEVRDSIVMQGSKIGAGASIRYCILDKNVTIRPGTQAARLNRPPACGRQRRYRMKIAVVASEAAPFVKTGGLGDVMQALPLALSQAEEHLCQPLYPILQPDQVFRASGRQNF